MKLGDKVWWLKEEKRGWGGTRRIGANVIKVTAKRVIIAVKMQNGRIEQRAVKPEKLIPMDE